MKKWIFGLGIIFISISESLASCTYYRDNCLTFTADAINDCGRGCTYTYEDGTVYITTSENNAKTNSAQFSPYSYDGNAYPSGFDVNHVIIDGPIAFDDNTFTGANVTISGNDGVLTITKLGHHAFGDNATLTGDIIIPSDATFDSLAFYGVQLGENAKIYCAVENCAQKIIESCYTSEYPAYTSRCLAGMESIVSDASQFEQAPKGCASFSAKGCSGCNSDYLSKNGGCVSTSEGCGLGYKANDGICEALRRIYTIDEANAVAGKTNRVSIRYR